MNPADNLSSAPTIRGYQPQDRILRRYVLQRFLGRGGMGVVWLAHDEQLQRDVALKVLPEFLAYQPAALEDLRRETRRSLDLTHPNIVRVYDFVSDASGGAISMEFVDGETLAARLVKTPLGAFGVEELKPWVRQLCEALDYAHTRSKVIHRDLKPANLMLTSSGELKVADFGIARSLRSSASRVTQTAGTSGTLAYMSPQQLLGEDPGPADDIYSLGATLYELLTGKPPFSEGDLSLQIREKVPLPVNTRRAKIHPDLAPIPTGWETVIAACLEKKVEDRPASVRTVAERLGVAEGLAWLPTSTPELKTPPDPASVPKTAPVTRSTWRAWRWLPWALAAGTVIIVLYVGVLLPNQRAEQARLQAESARKISERQVAQKALDDERQRTAEQKAKTEQAEKDRLAAIKAREEAEQALKTAQAQAEAKRLAEERHIAEEKAAAEARARLEAETKLKSEQQARADAEAKLKAQTEAAKPSITLDDFDEFLGFTRKSTVVEVVQEFGEPDFKRNFPGAARLVEWVYKVPDSNGYQEFSVGIFDNRRVFAVNVHIGPELIQWLGSKSRIDKKLHLFDKKKPDDIKAVLGEPSEADRSGASIRYSLPNRGSVMFGFLETLHHPEELSCSSISVSWP